MLVVAAAGNANQLSELSGRADVLAVSATTSADELASYSNRGPYVGIAAAGGDIEAGGEFGFIQTYVWSTTRLYPCTITDLGAALDYFGLNGTSVASPASGRSRGIVRGDERNWPGYSLTARARCGRRYSGALTAPRPQPVCGIRSN